MQDLKTINEELKCAIVNAKPIDIALREHLNQLTDSNNKVDIETITVAQCIYNLKVDDILDLIERVINRINNAEG